VKDIIQGAAKDFIELFGRTIMGKYRKGSMFTTKTGVNLITTLATLNWLTQGSIFAGILRICGRMKVLGIVALRTLKTLDLLPPSGTEAKVALSGTSHTLNDLVLVNSPTGSANAPFAIKSLRQKTHQACFVQTTASQKIAGRKGLTILFDLVKYAEKSLLLISTKKQRLVECLVVEVSSDYEPNQPVYDISVYNCHSYTANGLLVHNCIDAARYWVMANAVRRTGARFA
jgi:hypothetical protein